MKMLFILGMACLLALSPALAQSKKGTKAAATNAKLHKVFTQLYQEWDTAMTRVDHKTLASLYADEYRTTSPHGVVTPKAQVLADFKSGEDAVSSASTDDLKVTRHSDVAIVTCRWTAKEINKGQDVSGQTRWTDVWTKRAGRWQLLASHGSETRQTDEEAIQTITRLNQEWDAAQVRGDVDAIGRIVGDDYIGTTPDGKIESKASALADLKSGRTTISSAVTDQRKVTVYGNTAVVTGRWTASGKTGGKEWSGVHRFTDTWVHRNGAWQVVADQWSKINTQ